MWLKPKEPRRCKEIWKGNEFGATSVPPTIFGSLSSFSALSRIERGMRGRDAPIQQYINEIKIRKKKWEKEKLLMELAKRASKTTRYFIFADILENSELEYGDRRCFCQFSASNLYSIHSGFYYRKTLKRISGFYSIDAHEWFDWQVLMSLKYFCCQWLAWSKGPPAIMYF